MDVQCIKIDGRSSAGAFVGGCADGVDACTMPYPSAHAWEGWEGWESWEGWDLHGMIQINDIMAGALSDASGMLQTLFLQRVRILNLDQTLGT